jgi:hypothetical protein
MREFAFEMKGSQARARAPPPAEWGHKTRRSFSCSFHVRPLACFRNVGGGPRSQFASYPHALHSHPVANRYAVSRAERVGHDHQHATPCRASAAPIRDQLADVCSGVQCAGAKRRQSGSSPPSTRHEAEGAGKSPTAPKSKSGHRDPAP